MEKNAVMCREARCEKPAKSPCIPYHETSPKVKLELKKLDMCFVVSTLTGINNLLFYNFTQCVLQPYLKFNTLLFISLSTVVLNGRDRYEMYGFQRICTEK